MFDYKIFYVEEQSLDGARKKFEAELKELGAEGWKVTQIQFPENHAQTRFWACLEKKTNPPDVSA